MVARVRDQSEAVKAMYLKVRLRPLAAVGGG